LVDIEIQKLITTSSGVTMSLLRATFSDESTRVHVAWLLVCMSYLAHSYIFVPMIHLTSSASIIHVGYTLSIFKPLPISFG
jgi:hypothetical protein